MEEERMEIMENGLEAAVDFHMQASLGFKLVGTDLFALYQKAGEKNTFLVMPAKAEQQREGMTIEEMVKEINQMLSGVNPEDKGLDSGAIQQSVTDVVDASKKEGEDGGTLTAIDWKEIKVFLNQAFLYLNTGEKAEYAMAIRIDTSKLFPEGQSFFNVEGLTLGIWNTDRKKVLEQMELVDVDACLKELE